MNNGAPLIILGVTGSIAAYKSLELIRRFDEAGVAVRVVATPSALNFFPVLPAEVFSGYPVETELFDRKPVPHSGRTSVRHLSILEGADLLLVAPATADFMARISLGMADDLLSTLALASSIPIFVAPAMEEAMYLHPASVLHRKTLIDRGVSEIVPEFGPLSSGKYGLGRMASIDRIVATVLSGIHSNTSPERSLSGLNVLISAGPTYEPLDAVRFLGNRSSGRMGYAMAAAARQRGARVTLVSGPTSLSPPGDVAFHSVTTATEMGNVLDEHFQFHHVLIMTAAVSDYRSSTPEIGKRKKDGKGWTLTLLENPDILKGLASGKRSGQFVIGFAAESDLNSEGLLAKLRNKKVDILVANDISHPETGFGASDNTVTIVTREGIFEEIPRNSKHVIANRILDRIPVKQLLNIP